MTVSLKSHADFRRFLADPRARVTILQDSRIDRSDAAAQEAYRARGMYQPRSVKKLQRNGVAFANPLDAEAAPSWMYWEQGTRDWQFAGDIVVAPNRAYPGEHIRYQCSLAA